MGGAHVGGGMGVGGWGGGSIGGVPVSSMGGGIMGGVPVGGASGIAYKQVYNMPPPAGVTVTSVKPTSSMVQSGRSGKHKVLHRQDKGVTISDGLDSSPPRESESD